mmetsp:Transcript_12987/g.45673  ORF Transcript_12987/g.45673 Transcript_12987/m.45673 type:complete len:374 (-) Transcript_12987:148-1269(-)
MSKVDNAPHDEEVEVSDDESVPDGEEESQTSDDDNEQPVQGQGGEESLVFGDEFESRDDSSPSKRKSQVVENQHFDEAVDVSSSESVEEDAPPQNPQKAQEARKVEPRQAPAPQPRQEQMQVGSASGEDDDDEEHSDTTSEDDDEQEQDGKMQGYNPMDYANLQVSDEIRELFQYIGRYKPQTIELETKLKPFIPEYIPAIGEIDPFLKIPRPDGKKDTLGLTVLDEPAAQQTDPTVLDLQLRAISTQASLQPTTVPYIENAAQHPQKITNWIQSISELHRSNPPPNVHYTKPMPDVETLMQMWSPEVEEAFAGALLPSADLNVDTVAYARIVCAILDIPVYSNITESLHVLFTLYSEFKQSNQEALAPGTEF